MTAQKPKCYNCKHATRGFKVRGVTHVHCESPTYTKMSNEGNIPSHWETLRLFFDTCKEHEFKDKQK